MKDARTQREIDLDRCECGHIRRHHYLGKGVCEGVAGLYQGAKIIKGQSGVCRCSRFKKAKVKREIEW